MIAKRIAKEVKEGYFVNLELDIGGEFVPIDICKFQSENGVFRNGTIPMKKRRRYDLMLKTMITTLGAKFF
jgi:3-oxoacid CoA-transferase subunit B